MSKEVSTNEVPFLEEKLLKESFTWRTATQISAGAKNLKYKWIFKFWNKHKQERDETAAA